MFGRRGFGPNHDAIAILAAAYVFCAGLLICVFIALAFATEPLKPLLAAGAIFLSAVFLVWVTGGKTTEYATKKRYAWLLHRRLRKTKRAYQLERKVGEEIDTNDYGNNEPPTAESVRDLAAESSTWVPSNVPRRQDDDV